MFFVPCALIIMNAVANCPGQFEQVKFILHIGDIDFVVNSFHRRRPRASFRFIHIQVGPECYAASCHVVFIARPCKKQTLGCKVNDTETSGKKSRNRKWGKGNSSRFSRILRGRSSFPFYPSELLLKGPSFHESIIAFWCIRWIAMEKKEKKRLFSSCWLVMP